jgi:hypothetical protein
VEGPPRALLKSQDRFAAYVRKIVGASLVTGWFGSLPTLEPGEGYKLLLGVAYAPFSFKYPVSGPAALFLAPESRVQLEEPFLMGEDGRPDEDITQNARFLRRLVAEGVRPQDPDTWNLNPHAYPFDMTAVMTVGPAEGEGTLRPEDTVTAWLGDELRGMARPLAMPGREEPLVFLMVYGSPREDAMRIVVHDAARGILLESEGTIPFAPDARLGTVREPLPVTVRPVAGSGEPALPVSFAMAPLFSNPLRLTETAAIRYALPVAAHVALRVFDVQGREVVRLVDETKPAGWHEASFDPSRLASGAYFYRIDAAAFTESGKLILVK